MISVDARAIARVAQNSKCRRQAAMILLGLPDWACRDSSTPMPSHGRAGSGQPPCAGARSSITS